MWQSVVESINTGSGKATLALVAGVLALVAFWFSGKDRGLSRAHEFEDLRQSVVEAMSRNDAALTALSLESEMLNHKLEEVLLIVPVDVDTESARQALEVARGFSAKLRKNVLLPRRGANVHEIAQIQFSEQASRDLRARLMSESITAGHLTHSQYDAVFGPVKIVLEGLNARYGPY